MSFLENLLSAIIVVGFLAAVIFYDSNDQPTYYDCENLHLYKNIPEEVVKECFRLYNKAHQGRSISI